MPISYRGTEPSLKMSQKIYNELRKYAIAGSSKMLGIFMDVKKDCGNYVVKELYVPEQSCNTSHCIISEHELRKLGVQYIGLCRTGSGTKIDFAKDDLELYDKSFSGLYNYVCLNFTVGGNMSADIVDNDITFEDVNIVVLPEIRKDELDAIKDFLDERVKDWSYKDGYSPNERSSYVPTPLLTENIGWRDVC